MKRPIVIVAGVLLIAASVVAFPSVRLSYLRYRADGHLKEAEALRSQLSSPVARDSIAGAGARVRFTLMRPDATSTQIVAADKALVDVMTAMKSSPPPDRPVFGVTTYDRTARAGQNFAIDVSVRSAVAEAFVVAVTAELTCDSGWRSGVMRRDLNQPIRGGPVDAHFEVTIPADAAGQGRVRTAVIYRLNPTGEGEDLQERSAAPLPVVTIERGAK
jgi:hypothetical protein